MATLWSLLSLVGSIGWWILNGRSGVLAEMEKLPQIWSKIEPHNAYHMVYRLQQSGFSEPLTIEEWASFKSQLFRLDLISSETRLSYVSDGQSCEMFKYKPFTCENLNDKYSTDLDAISKLFKGYSLTNNSLANQLVRAFGIGPLWLRAQESAKTVIRLQDTRISNKRRGAKLEEFLVSFEGEEYKLGVQFENGMLNVIEWIDTKIVLGERAPVEVLARAKLAMFDLKQVSPANFELPLGYGCQHSDKYEDPLKMDPKFTLFRPNSQHVKLTLDVATSRPLDLAMTNWDNQASSTTVERASLIGFDGKVRQYYASTSSQRNLESGEISKMKRVWSAGFGAGNVVEYKLDIKTDECQQLNVLFSDNVDYHFVREEPTAGDSNYRTGIYEKRMHHYEVRSSDEILFNGPVSIVKKVTSLMAPAPLESVVGNVHVSLAMYFYSQDLSRLEYKLVFDPQNKGDLSETRRYPDLQDFSVADCFSQSEQERLMIKYALDSTALSQELKLQSDAVEQRFLDGLFHLKTPVDPLQVTDLQFSLDPYNMYVELTLLDLPLWQTWDMKPNARLVESKKHSLVTKMESSLDKCSRSCQHYHCQRFSYEFSSFSCLLELERGSTAELKTGCDLYNRPSGAANEGAPLRQKQILAILIDSLSTEEEMLAIHMKAFGQDIRLMPTSIHSDMESMNEFIKSEDGLVATYALFRMEYIIHSESRQLISAGQQLEGLSSYEDCSQSCEEADCRSFSYCSQGGICRLSQLHQDEDLEKRSERSQGCTLFVLDYLSKFEELGSVGPPLVVQLIVADKSQRDCANLCLDEQEINCQLFYHCKVPVSGRSSCLLLDKNIMEIKGELSRRAEEDAQCRLFSRSYLSQFDQYHGKELQSSEDTRIIEGLGADECASRCIGQFCLAFDVCHKSAGGGFQCRLAGQVEVRRTQLVDRKNCNTFVLSDKSRFNWIRSELEQAGQRPDKPALEDDKPAGGEVALDVDEENKSLDVNATIMRILLSADNHQRQTDGQTESNLAMQMALLVSGFLLGLALILAGRESYKRLIERSSSVRQ